MPSQSSWLNSRIAAGAAALVAGAAIFGTSLAFEPTTVQAVELPATVTAQQGSVTVGVSGSYNPAGAKELLEAVNAARANAGVEDELTWSDALQAAAQQRAAQLAAQPGHPQSSASTREAAAWGSASDPLDSAVTLWSDPAGSAYAVLTDASVDAVGISAFTLDDGTVVVVAEFGSSAETSSNAVLSGPQVVPVSVSAADLSVAFSTGSDPSSFMPGQTMQLSYTVACETLPVQLSSAPVWSSSNAAVATVDAATGLVTAMAPGQVTVSLASADGVVLGGVDIAVEAPVATSASVEPVVVDTAYGVLPELPATASVTYSDGSVQDVPVSWNAIDQNAVLAGNTSFTAIGTADSLDVSIQVNVGAPAIQSVEDPQPVETERGSTPELPQTVTATLQDGTVEEVPVTWALPTDGEPMPWDGDEAEVQIQGTVDGYADPVTLTVNVAQPADNDTAGPELPDTFGNGGQASGDGQNQPSGDQDQAGEDSQKPAGDGDAGEPDPAGDEGVSDGEQPDGDGDNQAAGGDSGDAGQPGNEVDGDQQEPGDETTDPDGDQGEQATVVASFENPADVYYALEGADLELPSTIDAVLPDGSEAAVAVTWTVPDASAASETGELVATAPVLVASEDGGEPQTQEARQVIQLLTVAQTEIEPLAIEVGAKPELPETVAMAYKETTVNVPVSWDEIPADATAEAGTFTVQGTVNGNVGPVEAEVTVAEQQPAITTVVDPEAVTTTVGTAPELPKTVAVTYANGTEGEAPVTWDEVDEKSYAIAGSFRVDGTVEGTDLPVSVQVVVVEEQKTVEKIDAPAVETTAGTAPVLPATVEVTWSDGTSTSEPVTWASVDATLYAKPGSFTVSGSLTADPQVKTTCTVKVTPLVVTPTGVVAPADVTTDAGVAPVLPTAVDVTYSDGTVKRHAITWASIDPASYHNEGSFSVTGTVDGTDLTTQIKVVVAAPKVAGIQNNLAVQTNVGTAPALPKTASVRWSNGDTTNEPVTWNAVDPSSYAKAGTFTAQGTVVGHSVSCAVTVVQPAPQVVATGDTSVPTVAIVAGAVVGVAVIAAAVALIVASRKRAKK